MKLLEITMSDVKPGLTSIIPIGSIEQHGPHLPLGTDSIIVQYLVDVINEKFNDKVLVCPTIYITCSFEHLGFPGTLTIEYTTLLKYLLELFKSLRDSCSVKSIVIVNGHGGIIDVINLAVKKWNYTNIGIKAYHYYIYNESVLRKIKSLLGLEELDDFHADIIETNLLLAINKSLVKLDRVEEVYVPCNLNVKKVQEVTDKGIVGLLNKKYISIEIGQKILSIVLEELENFIKNLLT